MRRIITYILTIGLFLSCKKDKIESKEVNSSINSKTYIITKDLDWVGNTITVSLPQITLEEYESDLFTFYLMPWRLEGPSYELPCFSPFYFAGEIRTQIQPPSSTNSMKVQIQAYSTNGSLVNPSNSLDSVSMVKIVQIKSVLHN